MKIYKRPDDLDALFSKWEKMKVDTAFTSIELALDPEFRQMAARKNIPIYLIFSAFFDPEALEKDPDLFAITNQGKIAKESWVEFVCPSNQDFQTKKINRLQKILEKVNPDGLSIDFIRHFVFWEMIYPDFNAEKFVDTCYCESCIARFLDEYNIDIPNKILNSKSDPLPNLISGHLPGQLNTAVISTWIKSNYFEQWIEFRCELVLNFLKQILDCAHSVSSKIKTCVHVLPWREDDFSYAIKTISGQDIPAISQLVDFVSPMCYSHMVKQDPQWISNVVSSQSNTIFSDIIPAIQVGRTYIDEPFSESEFNGTIDQATKTPSKGVIFWCWEAFEKEKVKQEVVSAFF